jgi:hypothetical protein
MSAKANVGEGGDPNTLEANALYEKYAFIVPEGA